MKRNPVMDKENDKEEMDNEDETEEEEKSCASKKSQDLTEDDLVKAIGRLESFATEADPNARKNALLAKALEEDLGKSEQEELMSLISGGMETEEVVSTITKSLEENETIQKAMDVSDFLSEQTTELTKALGALEGNMQKSDKAQHEFNLMLARAVTSVGHLTKSIFEKLDVIGEQPVRKPSSIQPLKKGFAGNQASAQDNQLSKSEILSRLGDYIEKGGAANNELGFDLVNEVAKFEMTGTIDPRALKLVTGATVN